MATCPVCDCCNCTDCTEITPDDSFELTHDPTDCVDCVARFGAIFHAGSYTINPCRPSLGEDPSTCEDKWDMALEFTGINNTDCCVRLQIFFDISDIVDDTKCQVNWKADFESEEGSPAAGNGTWGLAYFCLPPHTNDTFKICFRLIGCQDPCCFQTATISNFGWFVICNDATVCTDDDLCDKTDCPLCSACCTTEMTGECCGGAGSADNPGCTDPLIDAGTATGCFEVESCFDAFVGHCFEWPCFDCPNGSAWYMVTNSYCESGECKVDGDFSCCT